jgi:hypothetical protein
MRLTDRCRGIIAGAILGDGCLERNGRFVRLRIDHGERQKALVEWKHKQLAELSPTPIRRVTVLDQRTGKTYVHYRFETCTTPELEEYYHAFYSNGVKQVPSQVASYLTSALSIAVWYMDDGSRRSDCCGGYFNTQGFALGEVSRLQECLARNFGFKTRIHWAAGRPRIYVAGDDFRTLCTMICAYVIPELQYKLL